MTDRGLNTRLRQRSRRAGIMIGVSMAITIALCVAGFSVIYSALDPLTSDFVSNDDPTETAEPANDVAGPQPTTPPTEPSGDTGEAETPAPTEAAAQPTAASEGEDEETNGGDNQIEPQGSPSDEFTPDYQISAGQNVRLRSGPGTDTDTITSLTAEQELQYLGESQASDNPQRDGLGEDQEWMRFRTEDGEEGWVREIDVEPYQP